MITLIKYVLISSFSFVRLCNSSVFNAVCPLLFFSYNPTPLFTNKRTISTFFCGLISATCNGVSPSLFLEIGVAEASWITTCTEG